MLDPNSKTPQEWGYWFQDEVASRLKAIQKENLAYYHRFSDSKSARNIIASQPADHMLVIHGSPWLIEEKASTKHSTFKSCTSMLDPKQKGEHIKWNRAGGRSLIAFYCVQSDTVELWDWRDIEDIVTTGKRLKADSLPVTKTDLKKLKGAFLEATRNGA